MIEYKQGNIALAQEKFIAHGCNAQGVMASGVAKEIRRVYPQAYFDYIRSYQVTGLTLGTVLYVPSNHKVILNCITQEYYGKDGKMYASYNAVRDCLQKINTLVPKHDKVAMPRIGCGLGGLEWSKVEKIIEESAVSYSVVVYDL